MSYMVKSLGGSKPLILKHISHIMLEVVSLYDLYG